MKKNTKSYIGHGMRVKKGKRTGTVLTVARSTFYNPEVRVLWDDIPDRPLWVPMTEIKPLY